MTDLTTRRLTGRQDPGPPPALPGVPEQRGAVPSATAPVGVPLRRLLAMARLSAVQALELGAGVLAAAEGAAPGDTREGSATGRGVPVNRMRGRAV